MSVMTAQAVIIDKIAAIVNDDVITQSEIDGMAKLDLRLSGLPRDQSMLEQRINHHLVLQQLNNQPPVLLGEDDVISAFRSFGRNACQRSTSLCGSLWRDPEPAGGIARSGSTGRLDQGATQKGANQPERMKNCRILIGKT
jgi:hypothetical protein